MGSVESTKPRSYEVNEGAAASGPAGSPNLLAALDYAERSWHVFPCWWIKNGSCACGTIDCQHPGKHPLGRLAPNGKKDASTDQTIIKSWWGLYPDANIGVVTGHESGLVVLDEDPRNGGTDSLKKLESLGNFPLCPVAYTGGGGQHIYFEHPGNGLKIKSRALPGFPGIDIKGDGGYVVAPPSNHVSGRAYSWKVPAEAYPPAKIPDWLLTLLFADTQPRRTPSARENHGEKIHQGARNTALASLAGTMRRRGMSLEAIEAALLAENMKCDPPLAESEVLAIAKSVSKYAPGGKGAASGSDWPEPEPLRRSPEPGESFPMEALGPTLGEAAAAIHAVVKAPAAICGQAVLAAANLAVQGFADVHIDGRRFPISEFFLSVALSGDRKSAADRAALAPVDAHEKELMTAYKQDFSLYEKETLLWKRDRDAALKKLNDRREALEALPPSTSPPYYPQLTTEEPTYEGLAKLLAHGHPSVGLFSDEAGRFFGGFSMNQENRLKTLAGLSALWDGRPVTRTRAGEGASTLYGRRVCAHFLMQPLVAETVLSDPLAHDQGFLSRCLIVEPESTLGAQTYVAQDLSSESRYGRYCARLASVLQAKLPLKIDPENGKPTNELIPRNLPVSPDGKEVWIRFHDWVQDHLREGGIFRPISGIAAKAAEHALRLAGTIALFENIDAASIPLEHLKAGIVLARFFLTESLRLFHSAKTDPDLLLAEKVFSWLKTRVGSRPQLVSLPCVYRNGPNAVRDKSTAARCMAILTDHGWTRLLDGGAEIDGKKRRQVWEVHPDV
jgi:hypothetical protein